MKRRAIVLLRCSTQNQDLEFHAQRADVERYLAETGLVVARKDWREEPFVSGAARRRPVLEEILDEAAEGKVSHLVCSDFDRLGRSGIETLFVLQQLVKEYEVDVVLVREPMLRDWGSASTWCYAMMRAAVGVLKLETGRKSTEAAYVRHPDGYCVARKSGRRVGPLPANWRREDDKVLIALLHAGETPETIGHKGLLTLVRPQYVDGQGVPTAGRKDDAGRQLRPARTVDIEVRPKATTIRTRLKELGLDAKGMPREQPWATQDTDKGDGA